MGIMSELAQAGIKGLKTGTKNFIESNLGKMDGKSIINMYQTNPAKYTEFISDIDNYVKAPNENLGYNIIKKADDWTAQRQQGAISDKAMAWVGNRKSSTLDQAGMRRNVMQYGYYQRKLDPDIPPSEISQGFKEEMGTMSYDGVPQKVVSGGSKPTKQTDISEAGQRKLQVQAVAENQARKDRGVVKRKRHKSTPVYTKMKADAAKLNSQALKDAKTQGMRITKGQQFVSVEHDVAITHASKYWDKIGYIGNEADNIFIQPNQLARQFKDNIENWFYPKSKDFVIKSDRSNLKDLIIVNIDTGQEVLRIPMPDDFKTGIPENITQQLNQLLGK